MTWRNEYEKSVLLFTKHCIIDAKIAVRFDAIFTALPFPFLLHSSFPVTLHVLLQQVEFARIQPVVFL